MQGHRKLIEAAVAWLQGDTRRAQTRLTECEAAARTYGLPWVSCAAARVRAHMLREQGLHESALDEARVAALHARQHGQWDLLRLIEEELPPSTPAQPGGVTLK
jgi:ATP/maltotriose-dependent transcriptional regulator MalT